MLDNEDIYVSASCDESYSGSSSENTEEDFGAFDEDNVRLPSSNKMIEMM